MISFKQRVLIAFGIIFLIVSFLTVPFAHKTVMNIAIRAMEDRAEELIARIKTAPNEEELVETLKMQKPLIFFRVAVISNEHKVLYDSHTKRVLGEEFSPDFIITHPEITDAFRKGSGYHEEYSTILDQEFAYFAKAFDFHGKTFVLRTAFPLQYVQTLSRFFEIGFITFIALVLLVYSLLTLFVINYLTRPIQKIIHVIKPFENGNTTSLPTISQETLRRSDEFGALGRTLNALSLKIQLQINTLIEEKNEKAAVLESLNEGVLAVDKSLIITYANKIALSFLHEDEKILGKHIKALKDAKIFALIENCRLENRVLTDAIELNKENQKLFVDLVAAPKEDGAVLVLQDKSAHYRLVEMRKDFIANASHELKTPITIIQGFAEALHDNPQLSQESTKEVTQRIVNNCRRMTTLIEDLLRLADMEKLSEAKLQDIDFKDIVEKAIDSSRLIHPDAIIELSGQGAFIVRADPSLIELAVRNLLENSAKYSDPPAKIEVFLSRLDDKVLLKIKDHGIGIPETDLPQIFDRFYRGDKSRSRKLGGSGLGLSIVQTIMEKHYGTISVTSTVGKGTTFTLALPTAHAIEKSET